MKRPGSSNAGFTLMEMMIGATVFSIGVLGSLGLLSWVMRANAFSTRLIAAGNHACAQLENLRELGFENATSGSDTQAMYELTWTVSSATNSIKTIDLSVAWDNADGIHKTMEYRTMVMDTELIPLLPDFALSGAGGNPILPPVGTTGGGGTDDGTTDGGTPDGGETSDGL